MGNTTTELLSPEPSSNRVVSVDLVRGLVMAIMALDHARDYLVMQNPTDLDTTDWPLFLTRWITHFCAPAFVFLAGVSVFLHEDRRELEKRSVSSRLIQRGLMLIALDLLVMPFFWWFNFDYRLLPLGVLWAIGWSMIALAGGVYLGRLRVVSIGLAMVLCHHFFDGLRFGNKVLDGFWCVLHVQTAVQPVKGWLVITAYPLIPWVGVLFLGYGLGKWLTQARNQKRIVQLGCALIVLFVMLRFINVYGDLTPRQTGGGFSVQAMSFLNCTKYPPSLLYLLMTLGPIIVLTGLTRDCRSWWIQPFLVLGRVPLFYYLVHLPLVHLLAILMCLARYGRAEWWFRNPPFKGIPEDYGWSLPVLYAVWVLALVILIPLCRLYMNRFVVGRSTAEKQ